MKQKLTKLLCSVFLFAMALPALAQQNDTHTITGKVIDNDGLPLSAQS